MKSRSLQSKLFFAYISLACLILFSFAVFFYAFVSRQLKQSQISAMNTLNSSFQTQVDSAIRNLDAVSVNINYSNQSKTILDNSFNLNISSNMLSAMSDLFISLSGTELKADQVNLYDFSGYVLEAGISTIVKKTDGSKDEWIEVARELEGKKVLTPPYCTREYTKTATYDQWFISLYRSFNNQYKRGVGVIETAKQCKSVFKSIITYKKKNHEDAASIYVFDSNGDLIYPYDISQEYKAALQPYYELTKGDDSALTFISPLTGKTEYAAECRILLYRLYLSYNSAGICSSGSGLQSASYSCGNCCAVSDSLHLYFLPAFPFSRKTGKASEAYYSAHGAGYTWTGKGDCISGFR